MSEFRKAYVYVRDIYAGILQENEAGYAFTYDTEYRCSSGAPVSLTLPVRENTYQSSTLFPFFDGLIPEGWLLQVIQHNWKVDANDRFGLLLAACKDCIGNVSIRSEKV